LSQAVSERDRCGPDFGYDVVVQAANTTAPVLLRALRAAAADVSTPRRRRHDRPTTDRVVVRATTTSVDVPLSNLWLGGSSLRLVVVAVNRVGPATGPQPSAVTVTTDPRTSPTSPRLSVRLSVSLSVCLVDLTIIISVCSAQNDTFTAITDSNDSHCARQ